MFVCRYSDAGVYTVGFYGPDDVWEPESDWSESEQAAARVIELNSGKPDDGIKKELDAIRRLLFAAYDFVKDPKHERNAIGYRRDEIALAIHEQLQLGENNL